MFHLMWGEKTLRRLLNINPITLTQYHLNEDRIHKMQHSTDRHSRLRCTVCLRYMRSDILKRPTKIHRKLQTDDEKEASNDDNYAIAENDMKTARHELASNLKRSCGDHRT